ncbi:inositol monophosphatase family protein [Corynebacterium epidermidicanis]|uniref:Inositol monophosphatase/fructose-1,6-bisphosphatase family protein n=1 Tax=Corynebacterium epidermidicanis TaxID=1050174 RepID=A0A0G3GPR3_9CORY|nr:inositol monophosphatase family protein [Corynebacterium epidermidicanis]AKK02580.1 inositol monophosphatase/fructose-1,6-bisphosphatase family protein [Corynebacterium epidermidicanis]
MSAITSDMLDALAKTFVIAHTEDSDEHLAQALVFNAGRLAWRMRETGVTTEQKTSISDVVTEADRAAENFVGTVLAQLRPEDGVLGEEGASREAKSGKTWVIDPVDGTYNFTAGSDYWCSALALVTGDPGNPDELHFGAVHRPAMGYTWFGGPKIPTTRDGKAVAPLADKSPADISLGTYLHPTYFRQDEVRTAWQTVAQEFASLRMLGAGSVDLGGVADGSLGAWLQHSVAAWDWLPGRALVEGAGGTTATFEAGGVTWRLAGNAQSVSEIRALF